MKKKAQPALGGEIAVFQAPGGAVRVEVRLQRDTVWLSLDQLTALFGRDKSVISRHLKNIFFSKELRRSSVVAKNATTATDGNKRIAAALFLWFLERNGALLRADGSPRIPDSALVALTLMIAESRPQEKDVLVRIVMHLLLGEVPA